MMVRADEVKAGDSMKDSEDRVYFVQSIKGKGPDVEIEFSDGLVDLYPIWLLVIVNE